MMKRYLPGLLLVATLTIAGCSTTDTVEASVSPSESVNVAIPSDAPMTAAEIEALAVDWAKTYEQYSMKFELVDPEAAAELANTSKSIYIASPIFGIDQHLMELSPILEPLHVVDLQDSSVWAIDQNGDHLSFLNAECFQPSKGIAACAAVRTVKDGKVVTDLSSGGLGLDLHTLQFERDGNGYWTDRYVRTTCNDSVYACTLHPELPYVFDCVAEHIVDGEVAWRWSALEHIPNDVLLQGSTMAVITPNDPFHCNAVQSLPDEGLVLVSMRHISSVVAIDAQTGELVWTFGAYQGPESLIVDDSRQLLGDRQLLSGNHDIQSLGHGRFSIFDNGSGGIGSARFIVFRVEGHTAVIETVVTDPSGTESLCTGSARPLTDDESFWAVSWGCSTSGISVIAADGRPVANLTIDIDEAREKGVIHPERATVDNLVGSVSYVALVADKGLLG